MEETLLVAWTAKSSEPTLSYERKVDLLLITSAGCSPAAQPLVLTSSVPEGVIVKLPGGKTTDGFDRKKIFLYWQGRTNLKVIVYSLHYTITVFVYLYVV